MFDTIKIKHYRRVLENYDFQNHWKTVTSGKYRLWVNNPEKNVPLPRLTIYRTETVWHIEAEVSLPKMIFGHNARLLNPEETKRGLIYLSDYVEANSGLPFDAETAIVARVDFVKDFHFPKAEIMQMIKRLSAQKLSRTDKLFFNDETLYFKALAKNRLIRTYDKFREVISRKNPNPEAIEFAKDKLRIEYGLLKSDSIERLVGKLGLPDRTAHSLLNQYVSDFVITEVLESLNFDQLQNSETPLFELLREAFGTKNAMNLFGFLEAVSIYGENFYQDVSFNFSKDSYDNRARKCRKAKVWKKPLNNNE